MYSLMTVVLFLIAFVACTSGSALTVRKSNSASCASCLTMAEAQINVELNKVLNEMTLEGCAALCSYAPANMTQHCQRVCFKKGFKAFMVALNKTALYIDPFAYCELEMGSCPVGLEDGALALTDAVSTPTEGPATTVFSTELHIDVTSPIGLGEVHVFVTQDSNGVSMDDGASIFLYDGLDVGSYVIDFTLDTTPDKPSPSNNFMPQEYYPGTYTIEFHVCQSMCSSAYPESYPKDFGSSKIQITVTTDGQVTQKKH